MVDVAGNAEKPNDATRASRPAALVCEPAKVVIEPDTPTLPPVMFEFVDTVFPTLTVPDTGTVPEIWAVNAVELESGQMAATVSAGRWQLVRRCSAGVLAGPCRRAAAR